MEGKICVLTLQRRHEMCFVCVMYFLDFEREQCCSYAFRRFNSLCMCGSQASASIPYHSAAVS